MLNALEDIKKRISNMEKLIELGNLDKEQHEAYEKKLAKLKRLLNPPMED